ncbi:MAG: YidC/Oxa1 family membrane protein insertase [Candidatus Jorgensenbacteria bacterium]
MAALYNNFIYQPILSALVWIYQTVSFGDLGVAIILLTVLIRVVLLPLFYRGAKNQSLLQRLQPHVKKIQLDHKDNKEAQARALMELYKTHHVNPLSGFFFILLQLPVFIALFQIFTKELGGAAFDSHTLLGLIDLEAKGFVLPLIAAAFQYFQGKLSLPPPQAAAGAPGGAAMGKVMVIAGPFITVMVLINLPSALGIYWIVSSVFSIGQQLYINRHLPALESQHQP